jgi:hypothetical protein
MMFVVFLGCSTLSAFAKFFHQDPPAFDLIYVDHLTRPDSFERWKIDPKALLSFFKLFC